MKPTDTLELRAEVPVAEGQEAAAPALVAALWDCLGTEELARMNRRTDFAKLAEACRPPAHLALMLPPARETRHTIRVQLTNSTDGEDKADAMKRLLNRLDARSLEVLAGLCALAGEASAGTFSALLPERERDPNP